MCSSNKPETHQAKSWYVRRLVEEAMRVSICSDSLRVHNNKQAYLLSNIMLHVRSFQTKHFNKQFLYQFRLCFLNCLHHSYVFATCHEHTRNKTSMSNIISSTAI